MTSLLGKRAIIAGASGLHASTLASALKRHGASVTSIKDAAGDMAGLAGIVDSVETCSNPIADANGLLHELTARSGPIDILVVCPPDWTALPDERHRLSTGVAMRTAFETAEAWTAAATGLMVERGQGAVVLVTGLCGLGGWRGWQAAGTAFAALHQLVRHTALVTAAAGMRINALVPGVTPALADTLAEATQRPVDDIRDRIPLKAFMPAAELENALVYLVHPASSYVTGDTLVVDGGWDVWGRLNAVAR